MSTEIDVDELRRTARWDRCEQCSGRLAVAWQGAPAPAWGKGEWVLRCTKNRSHNGTKPYFASKEEIDMVNQSSSSLVKYETPMGPVELSPESIRMYLSPKADLTEAYIFLQKCRFQQLNPFMGEAYLVIYQATQTSPRGAEMIIGKEAYTRRAERHPDYLGLEAGLIIRREDAIEQVAGAFMAPDDTLLGGWCKVHRKGKEPFFISVSLKEYDTGRQQWRRMPGTMIRKVAVVQALREAFPSVMAGLQGSDEFALAEEQAAVIEGQLADFTVEYTEPATEAVDKQKLERDIDELFPGDTMADNPEPPEIAEAFDPETAPPPPLPAHVSAMTHFEAVLKDQGWDLARFQAEVLGSPLAGYLRTHTLDQAYQLFKKALDSGAR